MSTNSVLSTGISCETYFLPRSKIFHFVLALRDLTSVILQNYVKNFSNVLWLSHHVKSRVSPHLPGAVSCEEDAGRSPQAASTWT